MSTKRFFYEGLIGLVIGLFLTLVFVAGQTTYFYLSDPPQEEEIIPPYIPEDVEFTFERVNVDTFVIQAVFVKLSCDFERLEFFGNSTGVPNLLQWDPLDVDSKDYDRSIGQQAFRVRVYSEGSDQIEIRTRHYCPDDEGTKVDLVMGIIDLPNSPFVNEVIDLIGR
jgi:hypothetical protein